MKGGNMPELFTHDHDGNVVPVDLEEVLDMFNDDDFYCVDGCPVEPDGTCPYGLRALSVVAGMI
jgi:hypothetical protein